METVMNMLKIGDVRYYLYGVASGGLYLLSAYGLLTQNQVLAWVGLFGPLFNLAASNTPTARKAEAEDVEDDSTMPEMDSEGL